MIDVRGSRQAIRRAYDLFSFFYGFTVARDEKPAIARGLAQAAAQRGERILDAGCGSGNVYALLRDAAGCQGLAFGIDQAPRMLAATRRRVPGAQLARAEIGRLPFPAGAFDLLWSSYVLDLIPTEELGPVLCEFLRVLRPNGRLLLVCFTKPGDRLTWWERAYRHTPAWLVPYIFGSCRPVHLSPYVQDAGFVAVRREVVTGGMRSEIITAYKPSQPAGGDGRRAYAES